MADMRNTIHGMKPALMMVLVQAILSAVNIGYKLAANDGMALPVLVAYRLLFGFLFIFPIAYFAERKKRPKLTLKVVVYGFFCGLFGGSMGQNLYLKSLYLTSATFISAMANLVPAVTFIIGICLRLERLNWKRLAGKAKVFGTLLGISGAMLFTFFKGAKLKVGNTGIDLLKITSSHPQTQHHAHNLVVGLILALVAMVSYALWLIIQAKASAKYPCPYTITSIMTFWGSLQAAVYAVCTQDRTQWKLGWNIRLFAALFSFVGSGLMFTLIAWCIRMRGALFVSMFNPLMLVMVAIVGILFLEEKLYLGMVLGSILIICGLYSFLWGQSQELKAKNQVVPENQSIIDENEQASKGGFDDEEAGEITALSVPV